MKLCPEHSKQPRSNGYGDGSRCSPRVVKINFIFKYRLRIISRDKPERGSQKQFTDAVFSDKELLPCTFLNWLGISLVLYSDSVCFEPPEVRRAGALSIHIQASFSPFIPASCPTHTLTAAFGDGQRRKCPISLSSHLSPHRFKDAATLKRCSPLAATPQSFHPWRVWCLFLIMHPFWWYSTLVAHEYLIPN